jgi:hypothetical protein
MALWQQINAARYPVPSSAVIAKLRAWSRQNQMLLSRSRPDIYKNKKNKTTTTTKTKQTSGCETTAVHIILVKLQSI